MENFIKDLLGQLIEEGIELKAGAISDFEKGKLFGYYAVISKVLTHAEAFGVFDKLPKELQEFNPESLL